MEGFFSQLNEVIINVFEKIGRVETLVNEEKQLDLTINEVHILEKIHKNNGTNVRDLAQALCVTTATVTVAIQKLVKKGYVLKEKSLKDLRGVTLWLTPEGTKVVRLHNIFHIRMARNMTAGLSQSQIQILFESLSKLDGHLGDYLEAKKTETIQSLDLMNQKQLQIN